MDKPIGKLKLLMKDGSVVDAILYCHQETTTIGGVTYYLLKKNVPADAAGTTLSVSTGTAGIFPWGKFVFQLTGVSKILAATIYATYRAYTGGGTVYAQIDIKILKADGTVRTTIATGVSQSAALPTAWATLTGASYSFAEYTVVDQTDYLEIDYMANVAAKKAGQYCYLRIDDNTLNLADQTRSQEWSFEIPVPTVETLSATEVSQTSARLNGNIVSGAPILERGFEWGFESGNYQYSWTETGTFGTGTYSYVVTGLPSNTRVYFRAKARNESGWGYGSEVYFDTLPFYKVEGYCLDESGNPVVGAIVKLFNAETDEYEASTTSDSTGKYSFTNLTSSHNRYVLAWKQDGTVIVGGTDVVTPEVQ